MSSGSTFPENLSFLIWFLAQFYQSLHDFYAASDACLLKHRMQLNIHTYYVDYCTQVQMLLIFLLPVIFIFIFSLSRFKTTERHWVIFLDYFSFFPSPAVPWVITSGYQREAALAKFLYKHILFLFYKSFFQITCCHLHRVTCHAEES